MSRIAGSVVVTRRRMGVHAVSGRRSRTPRVTAYNCLIWLPGSLALGRPHRITRSRAARSMRAPLDNAGIAARDLLSEQGLTSECRGTAETSGIARGRWIQGYEGRLLRRPERERQA